MNNFHLYEEIGHGKFSTVYKGRKRYTIRYVAVKSIEKSRREKVMIEVRVLAQLQHSNVVGFVNWYETRNHLWIIFEYCAGGELLKLLKQDGRLPEEQVRLFGRDICAGLLYVHSHSIIYSDLKTSNVLFNESGVLKLCDFGHAQHLEDVQRMLEEKVPLPRRGTPHYMAPELFQEGGMHSFFSDVWAGGCVIFELVVGRPPFHSTSFQQIQQMVLWDPMPLVSGLSTALQSLLASLLRKGPLERAGWPAIREHAFWQDELPGTLEDVETVPLQPHVEELQRLWQRMHGGTEAAGGQGGIATRDKFEMVSPIRSEMSPAAAASEQRARRSSGGLTPGSNIARGLDFDAQHFQELHSRNASPEAPSEFDPPRRGDSGGGGASGAGVSTRSPASQAPLLAVPALAPAIPLGSGATAGCLRSRLGATVFVRIRELALSTDTGVRPPRPISRNHQIEELEQLEIGRDLPFVPLRLDDASAQPHAELEAFLTTVYKCIAQGAPEHKIAALAYLELICCQQIRAPRNCQMQIADLVVNSSLLRLILRMLLARRSGAQGTGAGGGVAAASPALRARLLALIGQLLRHTTYLEPNVVELGLFDALLESLREQDVTLRRRAAAALGELLFYIAAQPEGAAAGDAGTWHVPDVVLRAISDTALGPDGDKVAQHYAVKAIENIATQCPAIAQNWFFSLVMLQGLAAHVCNSSWDAFRISCLAAVVHLVRGSDEQELDVLQSLSDPSLLSVGLGGGLGPQAVAHGLQLVAAILLRAPNIGAAASAMPSNVVDLLMGVMSQPRFNVTLRARAALLLSMLCALDDFRESRCLRRAIEQLLVSHVDRLGRDKDQFAVQCVAAAVSVFDVVSLFTLQCLLEGLRQLAAATSVNNAAALADSLVQVLPVFLHLVSSATLCACIVGSRTLPLLGAMCELAARIPLPPAQPSGGSAGGPLSQVQPLVLVFMETISAQQGLVLEHASQMVHCILPTIAAFLPSNRIDVRLLALKSLVDICIMLLNDFYVFDPMAESPSETTVLLEAVLCNRVLPTFPSLLGDEFPTPSYAFRLLATLLSRGSRAAGTAVHELNLAPQLLAALRDENALTLHSALLAHCLLQGREVSVDDLEGAGILSAVHAALAEAAEGAAGQEAPQLDFAMLDAALGVAEEAFAQQQEAAAEEGSKHRKQGGGGPSSCHHVLLVELGELAHALELLAHLCLALAHAMHAPLLDRCATCCQLLASLAAPASASGAIPGLSSQGVSVLIEALAVVAQWHHFAGSSPSDAAMGPSVPRGLQRRVLAVLGWAVAGEASAEVRAVASAGVEQLLQDRAFGDDPEALADARQLMSMTMPSMT